MTEDPRPRGSQEPLDTAYDVALLDLDGVVYLGGTAIPGAAEALRKAAAAGMRLAYVTNNAFRTPAAIAALLTGFGAPASPQDVVTSAQAAARLLAERLPADAAVLVIGGSGLRMALRERGLRPVSTASDQPQAVVQGYSPDVSYSMLAEGGLAVAAGALFVASNGDLTLPSRRGRQPGNGSLIQVVATATGVQPVAGKPEPPLHHESVCEPAPGIRSSSATGWTPTLRAPTGSGRTACSCSPGSPAQPKPWPRRRRSAPPTWPRT
jgi:HAD superfamily hydrolase (TIGR01450 family)